MSKSNILMKGDYICITQVNCLPSLSIIDSVTCLILPLNILDDEIELIVKLNSSIVSNKLSSVTETLNVALTSSAENMTVYNPAV